MSYVVNYPQVMQNYSPYGYPPVYLQNATSTEFDWMLMLGVGLGIFLAVVLIYISWVYNTYRYSSDRIASKLITKFKAKNKALDPPKFVEDDRKELAIEIATLNSNLTIAAAQVAFRDKESHNVLEYTPFTATNRVNCSPMDNSCIRL